MIDGGVYEGTWAASLPNGRGEWRVAQPGNEMIEGKCYEVISCEA
jgi:hypothetical protein